MQTFFAPQHFEEDHFWHCERLAWRAIRAWMKTFLDQFVGIFLTHSLLIRANKDLRAIEDWVRALIHHYVHAKLLRDQKFGYAPDVVEKKFARKIVVKKKRITRGYRFNPCVAWVNTHGDDPAMLSERRRLPFVFTYDYAKKRVAYFENAIAALSAILENPYAYAERVSQCVFLNAPITAYRRVARAKEMHGPERNDWWRKANARAAAFCKTLAKKPSGDTS
jgi:predicted ATPase